MSQYVEIKCQLDATDDFYCKSYCLLNMFRAPLCPSSGDREYYTGGFSLWHLVLCFSSCRYGVELRVMYPVCWLLQQQQHPTASNKICNKNHLLHLVGILFPHINDNARSKQHQNTIERFSIHKKSLIRQPTERQTVFLNIIFDTILKIRIQGLLISP